MKSIRQICTVLAALSLSLQAYGSSASVSADNPQLRWLPNDLPAAGYVTLTNHSDKPVKLTKVGSPDYQTVMLHQTVSKGTVQQMRMVDTLTIPAHDKIKIEPGGYHVMFEEPKRTIQPGGTVQVQFQFSNGEKLDTMFPVQSPAAVR